MIRAYRVRNFQLLDHQKMPSVPLAASAAPYRWNEGRGTDRLKHYLDSTLADTYTAGFLVIRNDSILYENYFNGFGRETLLPSFSVAKSYVSTLVYFALSDGRIRSLEEPVTAYLPALLETDARYGSITLQHLLDMRSGLDFDEGSYGLKDDAIRLGFRPNLRKHALKVKVKEAPGRFEYQSINTELLALVVEKATGKKVSAYLQEKLWTPLGTEYNATWNVDSKKRKQEIAFAGLNATARDFAKLGLLFLHQGQWNGSSIVDPAWIRTVNNADSMDKAGGYKNQWWSGLRYAFFNDSLQAEAYRQRTPHASRVRRYNSGYLVSRRTDAFHAEGILGQFIYVNPANNVVIVRLGRNWKNPRIGVETFLYELGASL